MSADFHAMHASGGAAIPQTKAGAIAVIGAGFSGTMAAIQLRRHLPAAWDILLVERSGRFARGVAFADAPLPHLLNVRAANMSAYADDPGHFERWLEIHSADISAYADDSGQFKRWLEIYSAGWGEELFRTAAGRFATRRLYGTYLESVLQSEIAASGGSVQLVTGEVEALAPAGDGWRLLCADGTHLAARGVVLAMGNLPSNLPCDGIEFYNPWTPAAVARLEPDAPVLISGTGLTMIDLVLSLQAQGFAGPIIALSRRGLVPQPHEPIAQPWPTPAFSVDDGRTALALFRAVRAELRAAAAQNIGWRAVIDAMRPLTQDLWCGLPQEERARFLRHIRPYWDTHRHRMAPPVAETINRLRANGKLRVLRGQLREVRRGETLAEVHYDDCPTGVRKTLAVQRVIHATGLQSVRAAGGLLGTLLANGQAKLDAQALGLEVTGRFNLTGADGQVVPNLWALGPIVRGMFWECIAVPDIRQQASQLARAAALALTAVPAASA